MKRSLLDLEELVVRSIGGKNGQTSYTNHMQR